MNTINPNTPRTNEVSFDLDIIGDAYFKRIPYPDGQGDYVYTEFAKKLETELDAATDRAACYAISNIKYQKKFEILSEALQRLTSLYESEQDFPGDSSGYEFRPEWLKIALGEALNATEDQP